MGMIANYMMVDKAKLNELVELDGEDLVEQINEMEEEDDEDLDVYCMDKLWDGLHFLLTGASASEPIEGDKLSEAVVGVQVVEAVDPEEGFLCYSEWDDLAGIIAAMEAVDLSAVCAQADLADFRTQEIYPSIWEDNSKEELMLELREEFTNLLAFYRLALEKKMNVIFSVF